MALLDKFRQDAIGTNQPGDFSAAMRGHRGRRLVNGYHSSFTERLKRVFDIVGRVAKVIDAPTLFRVAFQSRL